jgi:hypothetical protein
VQRSGHPSRLRDHESHRTTAARETAHDGDSNDRDKRDRETEAEAAPAPLAPARLLDHAQPNPVAPGGHTLRHYG